MRNTGTKPRARPLPKPLSGRKFKGVLNEPIWDIPEIIMRREYNALYGEMHEPSISFEDFYKFWNEKSRNWQYEERIKALIDHY
jgi:hypothetical protein